jgi:PAS domain S-box-containing protein
LAKGERWVEVHYSPVFDEKGQVESIVVLSNDISERRKAEQDLLLSELKFRTVADHTFDWEYWLGVNKRLVYMSPSCLRISGYSVEEFFADDQLLLKIVHPADSKIWKDHLDKVNAEDHPGNADELEYRIIKKDGSVAYIGHICTPVFDQKGYFIGRRVSNRGITNRKLAEQNLAKQTEELRLMNTYFVDREIKMIELKKEINRLLNAAGQAEKYEIFE